MFYMKIKSYKNKYFFFALLLASLFLATSGCSRDNQLIAAPLGNITALENLADGYNKIESSYPSNKVSLPPSQKREFIGRVFSAAGYDYTLTLLSMSSAQLDAKNKNQKDLAELLLVPTVGLSTSALADIYSDEELEAFLKLKKTF